VPSTPQMFRLLTEMIFVMAGGIAIKVDSGLHRAVADSRIFAIHIDAGVRSDEDALTLRETGFAYGG
jgi:hypothetical protein